MMAVAWDVSAEMVELLVADGAGPVKTRLQAVAVLQHCSLKGLSLFDFFQTYTLDGLRLVPAGECVPPVVDAVELPDAVANDWRFADWREDSSQPIAWRLERLRKHIAEVRQTRLTVRMAGDMRLLESLLNHERQLAKQCEPVPTLGLVADDPEDVAVHPEPAAAAVAESPEDDSLAAEAAEIAAVLDNPKSVVVTAESLRVDSKGRALVSAATLEQIYASAKLLGFANNIAAQEALCAKQGISSINDLTEAAAVRIVAEMKKRLATV